jgi:DNA-binding NtrC family response regulator
MQFLINQDAKANQKSESVLIIEDDDCLQTLLCNSVKALSPHLLVDWAVNGDEALTLLAKNQYRLVIADYRLPGFINGLWLWDKCKSTHPSTSFVMMSGMPVEDYLEVMKQESDAPPFLAKPFMRKEFHQIIQNSLDAP